MWTQARLAALLAMLAGTAFRFFFRRSETTLLGDETVYGKVGDRALRTGPWAPLLMGKAFSSVGEGP